MSQTYFAILTAVGEAKLANAAALGAQLQISRMGVGDGNGNLPVPSRTQTALINEQYRADLNELKVDPNNASQIIAELVIPETEGGYWLREMGLYDATGALIAVSNCPPSYKPQMAEGSGRTQVLRMVLIVSSTAAVQLKIDPSVVLATRTYADSLIAVHMAAADPHPQYTTEAEVNALIAAEMNSRDSKQSVLYTTTANINLSGLATQAGGDWASALSAGDRVLVKDQATAKDNGLYIAAAGAWTRATDADATAEITPGMLVTVEAGATLADTVWELTTNGPIVLGTTALTYELTAAMTATQADAEAGTNNVRRMTPLRVKQAVESFRPLSTDGISGSFSNLKASATGTNATVTVTADSVCVKNSAGQQKVLNALALTINSAAVGANGLDTGALAANTWYSTWVIYNPTSQAVAGLLSLSSTAPTLPAGYTYKARTGWIRTDGSANKYPTVFDQKGSRVQVEGASGLHIMGSSTGGSTSTTVAWGNFAPPTAGVLHLVTTAYPSSGYSFSFIGDTANIYGGCSYGITASKDRSMVSYIPKGTTVPWYYANLGSGTVTLEMAGWEDNL